MSFEDFAHISHTKTECVRLADKAQFEPLPSSRDLSRAIDTQTKNGHAPDVGQALNLPCLCIDGKVFAPSVAAWVEEPDGALRLFVKGGDGIGLVKVAGAAGAGKVVRA